MEYRPLPSAIFAGNDLMAVGAMYACRDAGLAVPGEIAVVGYDNREIAAIFRPAITTVTLPCYDMGEASAQMLLDLMSGRNDVVEEVKVRGRLIVRESCGMHQDFSDAV
jgi:DNA-binding LacI/PurR family transcriptional regulator